MALRFTRTLYQGPDGMLPWWVVKKATAKLSSKSQITVPAWVRKALGIGPGDHVALRVEDRRLIIEPADLSVDRFFGALRGMYGRDPDRYIRELRKEWDRFPLD